VPRADERSIAEIAAFLGGLSSAVRAGGDRGFRRANRWVRVAPWFLTRPVLAAVSLWSGGLGRPAFGQPGFPLGSAFVSNVGSLGLDEGFLAPLPLARCGLYVCLGAIRDRPVVVDGQVVVRPVLVLTATADHRLVDGAHAARLAAYLRTALADPSRLDK
jgi:pyruvate dehydrogenase E2 component (dihydrolipoamide acetyltransferase)